MGCCGGGSDSKACLYNSSNDDMKLVVRPLLPNVNSNDLLTLHAPQQGVMSWMQRDGNQATQQVMSTRWNPTPKQIETLEDIYRRGTRTPNAEQIQQITSQLRKFGKIEGKNVFYWFQNHKARERQKRRRRIETAERERAHYNTCSSECTSSKHVSGFHVEQIASLCPSTKTPTVTEQAPISIMRNTIRSYHSRDCANEANPVVLSMPLADQSLEEVRGRHQIMDEKSRLEADVQTLELFPLHSDHKVADHRRKPSSSSSSLAENCIGSTVLSPNMSAPFQFFHFLPLKN